MNKFLITTALLAAIGVSPAHAAVTAVFCGPATESSHACEGTPEQKVFLNEEHDKTTGSGNVGANNSGPVLLFTVDGGSTDTFVDTGGGFANITAANGTGFKAFNGIDITIPGHTFTDLVFDVQLAGPGGNTPENFTINAFSGAHVAANVGTELDIQDDKNTEFSVKAVGGAFDEVNIQAGPLGFDEIKHIEISGLAAIPEPSTWALMGIGFGLMGFLGYRKTRSALA
jgi:hypothetical protein